MSKEINDKNMCLIYKVKFALCDTIYIVKSQQTFRKIMDSHLSDFNCILKNGQKSYSFAVHYEQHFKSTASHTGLRKFILFKLVNHINTIGEIRPFIKPNYNLLMEEILTIF